MAQGTRTWTELTGLTAARCGCALSDDDATQVGFLLNSAARQLYLENPWWERFLVLEPRTVERGYVSYSEDSFNVYGAGTSEANGLYVRNGDAYESKNNYQIVKSSGITVSGAGSSGVNSDQYVQTNTVNGKPYYTDGAKFIQWISAGTPQWQIGTSYYSTDDVATPDLVTTWLPIEGIGGSLPVPSVSANNEEWQLVDQDDLVIYNVASTSSTPPETGWSSDNGEDPAPRVQALSEIGEYIGHWNGKKWSGANPTMGTAYPDQNGIRVTDSSQDIVYMAFKKSFNTTYGDGTGGTTSDVPAEWFEFMAYSAARSFLQSQRQSDSYQPIAISEVERVREQALLKINRQGIYKTIAQRFRTYYNQDVSIH